MKVIIIILLVITVIRLLLPYVIKFFVNHTLANLKEYRGDIKNITVNLFSGILSVNNLSLVKLNPATGGEEPFFKAAEIELSISWKALFRKTLVGTLLIDQPQLELSKDAKQKDSPETAPFSLQQQFQKLMPFKIDAMIKNGIVQYKDLISESKIDLALTALNLQALSISNCVVNEDPLPAKIKLTATIYEGTLDVTMSVNLMAKQVEFDLNTEVKDINLVLLNEFLRSKARIDVNRGTFGMYTELAAKNGAFKGYIKPVFADLDLVGPEDHNDDLLRRLWEGFVAVSIQVLKNKRTDQVATKISIEGNFDNPHINILSAILIILRNAFIKALKPSLEDVIDVSSVKEMVSDSKNFVKNLFSKD